MSRGQVITLRVATLLLASCCALPAAWGQEAGGSLRGKVSSAGGGEVGDATVDLIGTRRHAAVDEHGGFTFADVPPGTYLVQASSPRNGVGTASVTVVAGVEATVDLRLDLVAEQEEIVVTAGPEARSSNEAYTPADVVDLGELQSKMRPTLGETLAGQPGLSATGFGPGASRPVIRGFGGDRVRILENGVGSGDVSDTSPDHAVGVDPFSADRIEILRGPATLMYGSSAEGGVVNVLNGRIPSQSPLERLSGRVDLRAGSVAGEHAGALTLEGGEGPLAWHLDGFRRDTGDYESAAGTVANSDLSSEGGGGGVSWVSDRGFLGASVGRFQTDYGNPAEEEVRIGLAKSRYDLRGALSLERGFLREIKGQLGRHDYEHTELEGSNPGTRFLDDGWEGRLEAIHRPRGPLSGSFGVQVKRRDFEAIGDEAFVRPSRTDTWAAFLLEEVGQGALRGQLGLRQERQVTGVDADDLPDRSFGATSGSLGGLFARGDYTVALTVSRSVKLPDAEELYADGPHIATLVYEIGDPDLGAETSLGADLSMRKTGGRVRGELSLFADRIDGYIFGELTGEVEPGESGGQDLRILRFTQRDATFRGAEADVDLDLVQAGSNRLTLELGGDYVRAELRDSGEPLPRIPPLRYRLGLRYQGTRFGAALQTEHVARQGRAAENETETPGYALVDAEVSARWFSGSLVHDVVLRAANLGNQLALNHVSFLKEVAPLPGRNLTLSYRVSF